MTKWLPENQSGPRQRQSNSGCTLPGQTPKSLAALSNLRRICNEYVEQRYHIEVIDLLKNPALAQGDQIIAIPTLVKRLPQPLRKIIGDLSNADRVLVGLDLRSAPALPETKAARA